MKPFNFGDFISNEETPLVNINGDPVKFLAQAKAIHSDAYYIFLIYSEEFKNDYILLSDGDTPHRANDIPQQEKHIIYFKPHTQIINGIECPLPEDSPLDGVKYAYPSLDAEHFSNLITWDSNLERCLRIQNRVGVFIHSEDAQQVATALLKGIEK